MRDHLLVQLGIDLDEIQRSERQLHIPLRQRERQRDSFGRPQRRNRVQAAPDWVDGEAMLLAECDPCLLVSVTERLRSSAPSGRWRHRLQ